MNSEHENSVAVPLSKRELDILGLLARGLTDREIADRLVIAYTTVKWYNRQIFNKLAVENRQQAIRRAVLLGLVEPPDLAKPKQNLPVQLTPFVGRISELEDLSLLLGQPETRLITLLAPGGMGKTRLALQLAEMALPQFADGVFLVPLAPLTSVSHLIPTIAECVELTFAQDNPSHRQQLFEFLRHKHILLVLDNFEHLLEGTELVASILQNAPEARILITSRERLNIAGETVYVLGGMRYPDKLDIENCLDYAAVQLFVQCALRTQPHFIAHDQTNIVRVCQLVQGMPLAIELAAAWASTLAPDEIANKIAQSADFLQTSMSNIPDRMRSVRTVFNATWSRLNNDEKRIFRKLSVFRGGCTWEAAQAVTAADVWALAGLVNKALLWRNPKTERYEIHELLRQYAQEELEASDDVKLATHAHQEYFAQFSQHWALALKTPKQLEALEMLDSEIDNIRQAFGQAIEKGVPELIEPFSELWYFYEIRGWYLEGQKTFGQAIEKIEAYESHALAKLLAGYALFFDRFERTDRSAPLAEKSVSILRHLGAIQETPRPLMSLGDAAVRDGNEEAAAAFYQEGYEVAQRYNDQWAIACLTFLLGGVATRQDRFEEGKEWTLKSYALFKKLGNAWGMNFVLRQLARIAFKLGDYSESKRLEEECLINAHKIHQPLMMEQALGGLYALALLNNQLQTARNLAEDFLDIRRNTGRSIVEGHLILADKAFMAGHYEQVRQQVREVLVDINAAEPEVMIRLLVLTADLQVQLGMQDSSVEILGCIQQHYTNHEFYVKEESFLNSLLDNLRCKKSGHVGHGRR